MLSKRAIIALSLRNNTKFLFAATSSHALAVPLLALNLIESTKNLLTKEKKSFVKVSMRKQ